CENCSLPPVRITWPEPLQVGHVTTGPPVSPAPWQREHCSERFTVMFVVRPVNASSKLKPSGISMSRPRFGTARGGSGCAREAPPPKRSEKMSRKLLEPPLDAPLEKSNPENQAAGRAALARTARRCIWRIRIEIVGVIIRSGRTPFASLRPKGCRTLLECP
ncbi:MAG: hypothetical protein UZ17_ACD001000169, partial [Acidobacteria bacterium OLB17]